MHLLDHSVCIREAPFWRPIWEWGLHVSATWVIFISSTDFRATLEYNVSEKCCIGERERDSGGRGREQERASEQEKGNYGNAKKYEIKGPWQLRSELLTVRCKCQALPRVCVLRGVHEHGHARSQSLSCVQLCGSMDCSLPGSTVHGILQARILDWVAISYSRWSPQPKDQTHVSPALAGRFFTTEPCGKPIYILIDMLQIIYNDNIIHLNKLHFKVSYI